MDSYQRSTLADVLSEQWFGPNEHVLHEGEEGDTFFMIMSGTAIATKTVEPGKPTQKVYEYKEGDYFGERALLKTEPRAANIIATSDLQVVSLDRPAF